MSDNRFVGVPAGIENLEPRMTYMHCLGDFFSTHPRHDQIGHQQVNHGVCFREPQRLGSSLGFQNRVAM